MMHCHLNVKLSLHIRVCMPGDPLVGGTLSGLRRLSCVFVHGII